MTNIAVGPTASLVRGGVACAVFMVSPEAKGAVRWRPLTGSADTAVTSEAGLRLGPGKWISIAGEGLIRNSRFILSQGQTVSVEVQALYFDRVDVVAADFADDGSSGSLASIEKSVANMERSAGETLSELRRQTGLLKQVVADFPEGE